MDWENATGDFLKAIDGQDIESENIKTVREMLLGPPGSWVSLELCRYRYAATTRRQRQKNEIVAAGSDTSGVSVAPCTIVTGLDNGHQPLVSTLKAEDSEETHAEEEANAGTAKDSKEILQREVFDVTLVRGVRWNKNEAVRSTYSRTVSTTWT